MESTPDPRGNAIQVDTVPCKVNLPNGKTALVPIPKNATVGELQQASVLRASGMIPNSQHTIENTTLRLGGRDAAYLWKDDLIYDVVDHPENYTFHLETLVETPIAAADTALSQEVKKYQHENK